MAETPVSLLERLRRQPDSQSWKQFVDVYDPLIRRWLQQHAAPYHDAEDVVQEVMGVIVRELPTFAHDGRPGAFRRWLRTVTMNRLRAFWRSRDSRAVAVGHSDFQQMLNELEDPDSGLSRIWDDEHDRHVTHELLRGLEPSFEANTWKAFRAVVMEGKKSAEVASELGISVNAVLLAKSRVLRRLRQERAGLVD